MRSKKVWMAVAAVAVCIGFVCVGAGLAMGGSLYDIRIALGFEDGRPHFFQYDSAKEDLRLEDITSLRGMLPMGEIHVAEADQDDIRILNIKEDSYTLDISGKEAVLDIQDKAFYFFNFGSDSAQDITITVPRGFDFENLEIHNAMGDMELHDIRAKTMYLKANMGDINGTDLKTEGLHVENDMGDVELEGIFLKTTYIDNDMGDVDIRIFDDIRNYSYDAHCSMGNVKVNGEKDQTTRTSHTEHEITVRNSMGDISLEFD